MSTSTRTLEVVRQELAAARAARGAYKEGATEWKKLNDPVQKLKAEEARLANGAKASLPVGQIRIVEAKPAASAALKPSTLKPAPAPKAALKPDEKKKVVVVLPPYPNVASAVAYVRQQLAEGDACQLEPVFCHLSSPTTVATKLWQAQCSGGRKPVLFLEPKAVEKLSSSVKGAEQFNAVIEIVNKQDGPASEFWRARYHLPRLMTDIYFLDGADEHKVFERLVDVVRAFLRPQNGREWSKLKNYKTDMLLLWNGFNVSDAEVTPFSLPQYFRQLFCSGEDRKVIQEKVGWWITRSKACDEAFRKAAEKRFAVQPFPVLGRNACFVQLENYWDGRSFQYQWLGSGVMNLGVFRNSKRHVLVMSSPKRQPADLTRLYARLSADEPGMWFLHTTNRGRQTLMNGGFRYDGAKSTSKSSGDLIRLVQKYVVYGKK
jgi:hypothetical protein